MVFSEACEICCKMNPEAVEAAWGRYHNGLGLMVSILRERAIERIIGRNKTILVVDDMEKFGLKTTNLQEGFKSCNIKAEFLVMATLMNSKTPSILGRDGQVVYMLEDRNDAGGVRRSCEKAAGDVFCSPEEMQTNKFQLRQGIREMQMKEGWA